MTCYFAKNYDNSYYSLLGIVSQRNGRVSQLSIPLLLLYLTKRVIRSAAQRGDTPVLFSKECAY